MGVIVQSGFDTGFNGFGSIFFFWQLQVFLNTIVKEMRLKSSPLCQSSGISQLLSLQLYETTILSSLAYLH